jgi:hypothetical protein
MPRGRRIFAEKCRRTPLSGAIRWAASRGESHRLHGEWRGELGLHEPTVLAWSVHSVRSPDCDSTGGIPTVSQGVLETRKRFSTGTFFAAMSATTPIPLA